jgi:hypothetical protein
MKGTFFSADFIEDSVGNLRLLEVNTDTTISANNLVYLDFNDLISVLESNNITRVTVVHKPSIHQYIVNKLSESLTSNAPFITEFNEIKEQPNRIYPTPVEDAPDLFVLRMAYDESAIFDSEYAKGTLNTLRLFCDYNEQDSVAEFYHSSSLGQYDTISKDFNPGNLPDCLIKNISDAEHSLIDFYKIGSESTEDTDQGRWELFINEKSTENNIIQKYHIGSDTFSNNRTSSIRTFSIIYGIDLSLIHVAQFQENSVFELPTESIYNESQCVNKIDNKHYYEFATNFIKYDGRVDGILNTHLVIKSDDSEIEIGNITVGDEIKSYYIGGTDLTEDDFTYPTWQISGSTLPEGSMLTTSTVIYKNSKALTSKTLCNIEVNNNEDSLYTSPDKSFLVYDSEIDSMVWKLSRNVKSMTDYLVDYDGSIAQVTRSEVLIINEDTFSLIEIDVENTDTYIIAGSTPINSFVTHNAPCFVAGTKISLPDGAIKNIENIIAGDVILTFNMKSNNIENNIVNAVYCKEVDEIVEYELDNGDTLKCTLDHPLYVENKGWSSFNEVMSNKLYSIETKISKIEIGDTLRLLGGNAKIVGSKKIEGLTMVYNLQDVKNNPNFFANNILVHNRFQPKI